MEAQAPVPYDCSRVPDVVLRKIYSFLTLEDLVSVQSVCLHWCAVAWEVGIWRNVPYEIKAESVDVIKAKLCKMPALKVISSKSWYYNGSEEIVDALVKNVDDLREMNIDFRPPISAPSVQKLVNKHKNLESIKIDCYAFDLFKSLNILKECKNLKQIKFTFCNSTIPFSSRYDPFKQRMDPLDGQICRFLGDSFSTLERFDIRGLQNRIPHNDVLYLLERKCNILHHLTASWGKNTSPEMLDVMINCVSLRSLVLFVYDLQRPLDMQNLNHLSSLSLSISPTFEFKCISKIIFPLNLEKLIIYFNGPALYKSFLSGIISSLTNLKHLELYGICKNDVEGEMLNIGNLPYLKTLTLFSFPELSIESIRYIGQCKNLRHLAINLASLTDEAFECLKNCSLLQKVIFWECEFDAKNVFPFILSLKYLKEFSMTGCRANANEISRIISRCKSERLCVRFKVHFY